jgi:hypothetical protein
MIDEEILKKLYCDVLIKSMDSFPVSIAIEEAKKAVESFKEQFKLK